MMMSWLRSHGKSTSNQALFYCQPKTLNLGAEVMVDAKQAGKKRESQKKKKNVVLSRREF